MSTSLLKRAAETIKRTKDRAVKAAREDQHNQALIVGGLSSGGTAIAAAFADQKMGEGKQWKVGPVPAVAIFGAAALAPAFFTRKYPVLQAGCVSAGSTALSIAAYRYLCDEGIEPGTGT